jgi:VWFA-related protein
MQPSVMRRRLTMLAAALACGTSVLAAQDKLPAFRVAVDLVAVDVQVIDREGRPVAGLGPDAFEVTINGRRRRVVSAELIDSHTAGAAPSRSPAEASVAASPATSERAAGPGRVIVLAVDCLSFSVGTSRGVVGAARGFIARLPPNDLVGLFAYPVGPKVDPTTDRASVVRALDLIVGQRDGGALTQFHLRPSEIIDLNSEYGMPQLGRATEAILKRECGDPIQLECQQRLMLEVTGTALYYEGQANASLGTLRSLLKNMGDVPGRKTLVLASGGMIASDRPGGRPDINDLGIQVGKEAARSNTAIYTLHIDSSFLERNSAEMRVGVKDSVNLARDSEVLGRWLEQFSGAAGGALFKVLVGSGESAFDRILTETSSYYLLGVEPAEADRDGRAHEITVKVKPRNVTVRGRRWVTVPTRNSVAAAASVEKTPVPSTPPIAPALSASPLPRPMPADVQPLADAFERRDYVGMQRGLEQTRDLANLIRGFRAAGSPWPDAPRRAAVFALELGISGLRRDNGYARDEGSRLLAEYNALVRNPSGADEFECMWLWTEVAALEGLYRPNIAMLFVPRALQRCPNEPRLLLALAVVTEQASMRGALSTVAEVLDVRLRYEEAMKSPETAAEARVRLAWFHYRHGEFQRALDVLEGAAGSSADLYVRYLVDLVRGQVLRALGRLDGAAAAFRAALTTWPGAQSARVALMTLLVSRGDRQEAGALAEATETAPDEQFDPWWAYWLGDSRVYAGLIVRLRELGR